MIFVRDSDFILTEYQLKIEDDKLQIENSGIKLKVKG
jgi:hypothetical protein